jgi:hypothetical protein
MILLLALMLQARAQDYRFPAADEHYGYFYVTAYFDHSGVDWACGDYQYSGHRGNDYGVGSWSGMDAGRNLVATAPGSVVATNDGEDDRCSTGDCGGGGGYGNYVKIQHADGKSTYYAHMRKWTVAVSTGDTVSCGTYLGQVGSSGNSTGPHLHFEVRESSGSSSDPFDGDCSFPPSYWVSQGAYMGLPGVVCESVEPCAAAGELRCGDVIESANDAAGSTRAHAFYGCGSTTWSGSEIAWSFSTSLDEPVSLTLGGLGADLDLFALASAACDGSGCLAASTNPKTSDEYLSWDAAAGMTYLILVDGWEGATSTFRLEVACEGGGDTGAEETGEEKRPETGDSPEDRGRRPPGEKAGMGLPEACGCGVGARVGSASVSALLGLFVFGRIRRRAATS